MAEISAGIIGRKIPRKGRRILSPLELPTAWEKVACTCTYSRKGSGKKEKKNLLLLHFSLFFFQQPPSSCHPVPFPAISSSTSILLLVDSVVIASDSISRAIHLVGRRRGRETPEGLGRHADRRTSLGRVYIEKPLPLFHPFHLYSSNPAGERGGVKNTPARFHESIRGGRERKQPFSQKVEREKENRGGGELERQPLALCHFSRFPSSPSI